MTSQFRPNPYVGPRAFQDGETLYGRDREVKKLLNLLIAERIVLLYSPSGAGKTSLVQATLIPELRKEGFQVLPVIRVGLEPAPDLKLPVTANRYILSTLLSLEEGLPSEQQTPLTELAGMDLSTYLDQRQAEAVETDGDVLIFDQFEEIITVDPTDQAAKAEFFAQLGKTLRPRDRWALFSMREEYPAGLDPYLRPVPTRLSTTFRLELLGAKAARQSMQEPARQAGVPFTDAAAAKLIDDLRRVQVQQPDGTTAERPGLYIEPVQLQVVCYRLWENLPDNATEIREMDIREAGDVDSALAGYYADRVKATAENIDVQERSIREWFDSQLITEQGIRGQVLRGPDQSQGLANKAIDPLVDAHLVRAENRRGATWYELAHDRLIKPVKEDNAGWREKHLSPLQRQTALWESQNRSTGLLVRDEALEDAERWAAKHQDEILPVEQEFLRACQEVRAIAEREQKQTRRIRKLAIGTSIVSIVAIIAVIIGTFFFFQARDKTKKAIEAKNEAEQAKTEAERRALVSLAHVLGFQAVEQRANNVIRSALLARQAYLLHQANWGERLPQMDHTLRQVLEPFSFRTTVLPHNTRVESVAFSPDGNTLASGSWDGTVRIWNLTNSHVEPLNLHGHKAGVTSITFSPDGRTLASGSWDGTVRVWELTAPDVRQRILHGPKDGVFSVAFSPDGRILASGNNDGTVRIWQLTTPDVEPRILQGHETDVRSIAFSPDGLILASGGWDKTVRVWNLTSPDAEPRILHGHKEVVHSVAFSPDGRTLASGSWDGTVRLWDITAPHDVNPRILRGYDNNNLFSVAFSSDGDSLAAGSRNNTVLIWDLLTPDTEPRVLHGHENAVFSVAFSPDDRTLASGSGDNTVRIWDLITPETEPRVLRGHESYVDTVAFSPDSRTLASGSGDNTVRVWNLNSPGVEQRVLDGHENDVFTIAFSPDGHTLASGGKDSMIRVWNLLSPNVEPRVLRGHQNAVWSVAFSPDGRTLASGGEDNTVRLWNLNALDSEPHILRGHQNAVYSVAFSPNGRTLASGSEDNTVRIWNLAAPDAAPLVLRGHKNYVWSVAFSPDNRTLASGSWDSTVRVWDLTAPDVEPLVLRKHEGIVFSVAFNPDSRFLASGSDDNTVRVWDLTVLDSDPLVLRGHESYIISVAFSPDGKFLASGSDDQTIRLWNWRTERLVESICEKVWRNLTWEEWHQFISSDIPYERTCPDLPIHSSVIEEGQHLSKKGDMTGATAIFQRVLELNPKLELNVQAEINKWAALGKGEQILKDGNINEAVTLFRQTLLLDSGPDGTSLEQTREWGAQRLVENGSQQVEQKNFKKAMTAYKEAQTLDPALKISAENWGILCWQGSLWGHAADVLTACEHAITQAENVQKDRWRGRRGVARALTGNIEGAIGDLQLYVNWAKRQEWVSEDWGQTWILKRQRWIKTMQAGENPFTPEELEKLRNE